MPSTVIKHFDYDEDNRILTIVFRTGAVYTYGDVPEEVYVGFRQARSKGRYFNKHISGMFPFERVDNHA